MRIYELPGTRAYLTAAGCAVTPSGRIEAALDCPRPSRLERLELLMPGWKATVNGRTAPLLRTGEIFQAVHVPAGRVHVAFRFRPPYLTAASVLAGLGLLLVTGLASSGGP